MYDHNCLFLSTNAIKQFVLDKNCTCGFTPNNYYLSLFHKKLWIYILIKPKKVKFEIK